MARRFILSAVRSFDPPTLCSFCFAAPSPQGSRWLFYVVFDVLYVAGKGGEGEAAMDEVVRHAARESRAPCAPGIDLEAGNLTVGSESGG